MTSTKPQKGIRVRSTVINAKNLGPTSPALEPHPHQLQRLSCWNIFQGHRLLSRREESERSRQSLLFIQRMANKQTDYVFFPRVDMFLVAWIRLDFIPFCFSFLPTTVLCLPSPFNFPLGSFIEPFSFLRPNKNSQEILCGPMLDTKTDLRCLFFKWSFRLQA